MPTEPGVGAHSPVPMCLYAEPGHEGISHTPRVLSYSLIIAKASENRRL